MKANLFISRKVCDGRMAKYRMVRTDFWSNPVAQEEMTPEDKYFYLYLLTNTYKRILCLSLQPAENWPSISITEHSYKLP
jgi:hypothetical protein